MTLREHLQTVPDQIMDMAEECNWPYLWLSAVIACMVALIGIGIAIHIGA
ncbi:MAG: hypothetical protein WAT41_14460 [Flavobacteriales bacterium]